ncbi:hypothetical protein [Celeribacter naphthalenivorans]|uniref:hypothetical protein n=1 Tax=Celeribacter naphthalenivorans TaxID=1614694 RepID=UPI001CF986D1|nr:hypothetical protein [Celeribacter naphthalenivorans]
MTNQISTITGFNALSPAQKEAHREKVVIRASAILRQFWRDYATPASEQVLELEGWADVLESASEGEIRRAWAEYQRTGPRTQNGVLRKPDAGAIWAIVRKSRPMPKIVKDQDEDRPRNHIDAETRANILTECGFGHVVKRFPKVGDAQ